MKILILSLSLFLFSCATIDNGSKENKKEEYITATVISSSYNGQLTCFKKDTSTFFHRSIDYYSIQSNPDFDCYRNLYQAF